MDSFTNSILQGNWITNILIVYGVYGILKDIFRSPLKSHKDKKRLVYNLASEKEIEGKIKSRLIIYNNSNSPIEEEDIDFCFLRSQKIISYKIISGAAEIESKKKKINISFNHIDKSKCVVLEVIHEGNIEFSGRVKSFGDITSIESTGWLIFNALIIIPFSIALFVATYKIIANDEQDKIEINEVLPYIYMVITVFVIFRIIRFYHSMLWIPDSISSKYLDYKGKMEQVFKNNF